MDDPLLLCGGKWGKPRLKRAPADRVAYLCGRGRPGWKHTQTHTAADTMRVDGGEMGRGGSLRRRRRRKGKERWRATGEGAASAPQAIAGYHGFFLGLHSFLCWFLCCLFLDNQKVSSRLSKVTWRRFQN